MVRIKICGITRLDDALAAAEAGAQFLGLVFYPRSPRYIPPETAADLVARTRARWGGRGPYWVGVFVNTRPRDVRRVMAQVGLDLAQLHGDEPVEWVAALQGRAYKALRLRGTPDALAARVAAYAAVGPTKADWPQILLDAYSPEAYGGTGRVGDWALARKVLTAYRGLLAGGLTPENVAEAITRVHPWGVDVSSGVEAQPGQKDPARIRAFVHAVRHAQEAT